MSQPSEHGPARWVRLGERTLAETRVLDLRMIRYRHPRRQTEREFVSIHASDWVNVVPLTTDGRLVLVRQFRYGINDFSLEVPGGVIEDGEDPVVAGLRELAEETGYAGGAARLLGSVHPNPAIQDNRCHAVLADGVMRAGALAWDEDEEMEVVTAPVDDVLAWARGGQITHSLSLTALMLFEPLWRARHGGR
ncbi:MAG TPA: NUDIX hydrolase [Opitutaceae bacterium]|jgi:ADP-ribose pyrophosphatase|nr:NUDIX hydrolase [Opitutaceae bacterium]OQB95292.1 MAG: ADP-ribose pyrophosphatase [Verrucomicrobia bacterium ADurb.Bin122]MBP8961753.1 NUDIX hydrolase [Opitutaceae bacterium]HNW41912.1 NUDIX hydrolase [Opitutaceae bacterium]HOG92301.1 NUDIX hydrolase [Opitutaceae bacterium]